MFWRRRKQNDFAAEIESHIRIEADRLRQEGLSAAESESTARITEERFYESQRILWLRLALGAQPNKLRFLIVAEGLVVRRNSIRQASSPPSDSRRGRRNITNEVTIR